MKKQIITLALLGLVAGSYYIHSSDGSNVGTGLDENRDNISATPITDDLDNSSVDQDLTDVSDVAEQDQSDNDEIGSVLSETENLGQNEDGQYDTQEAMNAVRDDIQSFTESNNIPAEQAAELQKAATVTIASLASSSTNRRKKGNGIDASVFKTTVATLKKVLTNSAMVAAIIGGAEIGRRIGKPVGKVGGYAVGGALTAASLYNSAQGAYNQQTQTYNWSALAQAMPEMVANALLGIAGTQVFSNLTEASNSLIGAGIGGAAAYYYANKMLPSAPKNPNQSLSKLINTVPGAEKTVDAGAQYALKLINDYQSNQNNRSSIQEVN